jgi:hypothetical protein
LSDTVGYYKQKTRKYSTSMNITEKLIRPIKKTHKSIKSNHHEASSLKFVQEWIEKLAYKIVSIGQ